MPISTHTSAAGRVGETQQAIFAQAGVDLSCVIIGHSADSDDLKYLRGLMDRGSTIGMDRSASRTSCLYLGAGRCVPVTREGRDCREGMSRELGFVPFMLYARGQLRARTSRRQPSAPRSARGD